MDAKRQPGAGLKPPERGVEHGNETRKVDAMSELVAGLLLGNHDTSTPQDPSPTPSAVRLTQRPTPPAAVAPRSRGLVVALVVAIGLVVVLATLLLTR